MFTKSYRRRKIDIWKMFKASTRVKQKHPRTSPPFFSHQNREIEKSNQKTSNCHQKKES